jgi:poly(hydroxyalkanoate) granule-associated protein
MVKKIKPAAESTSASKSKSGGLLDSQLASSVKESAQQIWLAGMGAFSKAQEEGSKVFEALVKEGQHLQKKTQGLAEEKLGEVSGRMSAMADTVSAKAGQNWDKLESIFEARTAKALGKLGVPTAKELQALSQRVDELAAAVAKAAKAAKVSKAAKATKTTSAAAEPAAAPAKKAPAKRARKTAAA